MGCWYHMLCCSSKEQIENPFPGDNWLYSADKKHCDSDEEESQREKFYRLENDGRDYNGIIHELTDNSVKTHTLEELTNLFHEKIAEGKYDLIEIFAAINNQYTVIYDCEEVQYLAELIQTMRNKGHKYVWLLEQYY